jgi:hypothetical protein
MVDERYTARGGILDEAKQLTTGDRHVTYGPPDADFARTAGMLNALFGHKLSSPFLPQDVAKLVICIKLSRSVWNDKRDNYTDIAGYAACGWECIELAKQRESQQPKEEHTCFKFPLVSRPQSYETM